MFRGRQRERKEKRGRITKNGEKQNWFSEREGEEGKYFDNESKNKQLGRCRKSRKERKKG